MAIPDEYKCDKCLQYFSVLKIGGGSYRTPSKPYPFVFSMHAWCNQCSTLTESEHLLSDAEIDLKLKFFDEHYSETDQFIDEHYSETDQGVYKDRLELNRKYYRNRNTPPKCLKCGSTDILQYDENDLNNDKVRHPGCNGIFKRLDIDPREISFFDGWHWLTVEGDVIKDT